jgi:hypothetical protein
MRWHHVPKQSHSRPPVPPRATRGLSSWDIEVTDHRGRTVLIVPINDLQQNMKRKQAA